MTQLSQVCLPGLAKHKWFLLKSIQTSPLTNFAELLHHNTQNSGLGRPYLPDLINSYPKVRSQGIKEVCQALAYLSWHGSLQVSHLRAGRAQHPAGNSPTSSAHSPTALEALQSACPSGPDKPHKLHRRVSNTELQPDGGDNVQTAPNGPGSPGPTCPNRNKPPGELTPPMGRNTSLSLPGI